LLMPLKYSPEYELNELMGVALVLISMVLA
jgi:hypothetical protein